MHAFMVARVSTRFPVHGAEPVTYLQYIVSILCDIVIIVNILYSYPRVLNIVLYCSNNISTLKVYCSLSAVL